MGRAISAIKNEYSPSVQYLKGFSVNKINTEWVIIWYLLKLASTYNGVMCFLYLFTSKHDFVIKAVGIPDLISLMNNSEDFYLDKHAIKKKNFFFGFSWFALS